MLAADQCFVFIDGIRDEPQEELFSGEEEIDIIGAGSGVDKSISSANEPLAARMRPRNLGEVVGQSHILAEGNLLPKLV